MSNILLLAVAITLLYVSGSLIAAATATAGLIGFAGAAVLGSGPLAYGAYQLSARAFQT